MKQALTLIFCTTFALLSAQDIHFSQFNSSPLNINPALTGLFDGDARFVANYRNQWSSITDNPFITYSASGEINFKPNNRSKDLIGLGFIANSDRAGDGDFGFFQGLLNISYTKHIPTEGDLFLTYGMSAGFVQRSLNYQNLTFDNQYTGQGFNSSLSSGESFLTNSLMYFDASLGFNSFYAFNDKNNLNAGLAVYHVNNPSVSVFNDGNVRLSPRYTFHSNAQIEITEPFSILPGILILKQGNNYEFDLGSYVKYDLSGDRRSRRAIYLGGYFRLKELDAFIISTRIDYQQLNFGISYDINFSDLTAASNYKGGLELSLIYVIKAQKATPLRKNAPCPIFM